MYAQSGSQTLRAESPPSGEDPFDSDAVWREKTGKGLKTLSWRHS